MEYRLLYLLDIALKYHVSDIHFNYDNRLEKLVSIEMRVNDEIKRFKDNEDDTNLFRYLMYLANLDISNLMNPQTGNFEIKVGNKKLSLRFAVISTLQNTNGVLRILNNTLELNIDDLTDNEEDINKLSNICKYRDGLVIFAGPTGSGKTTTLYTLLNNINNKKIFTLEDPIEVVNDKFIQLQINEKMNLTYATGIKQLMRHDPDIVMIGEIRDDEATRMAVRCALTGHLVLSSIHSSSCKSAINRLIDLGVKEYQLMDVLRWVSTQNLFMNEYGRYTTVYEIMERDEIIDYFEKGYLDEKHKDLPTKIMESGFIA